MTSENKESIVSESLSESIDGACDADETILQFSHHFIPKTTHTYDKDFGISVDFIKLWTSFADSKE